MFFIFQLSCQNWFYFNKSKFCIMKKLPFFSFFTSITGSKKTTSSSIKNIHFLRESLKKCYTKQDISRLCEIKTLSALDFTINELVDFNLEIKYRRDLIIFCEDNFENFIYSAASIYSLFKKSQSLFFCDALILHLEKNIESYTEKRSDLSIFYNMAEKQAYFLKKQMFAHSA